MDFEKLPESVDDIAAILRHFGIESDDIHNVCGFAVAQALQAMASMLGESAQALEQAQILMTTELASETEKGQWVGRATMIGYETQGLLNRTGSVVFMKSGGKGNRGFMASLNGQTKDSSGGQLVH